MVRIAGGLDCGALGGPFGCNPGMTIGFSDDYFLVCSLSCRGSPFVSLRTHGELDSLCLWCCIRHWFFLSLLLFFNFLVLLETGSYQMRNNTKDRLLVLFS